ncbi:FtsX-like permease family protein [Geobacter sulfurreducens]|jgi:putative ABC transport system permease protein|uniref:ABC transporter, membrane protein n=1 Tax=Geobacter sulfurreducens (strain ATCC 51573 / DSM 12127 / PCA) TaxID=243231 RepID=Q74E01_GEOSL|nr:FtsX-like permease family protein [Geobacter sulfurreducens]AAR34539.1 ABC transporter, membrane protein [Geobacter sulfurreducens PCA]UAC05201.1 FtsX-like permease family protein [Geobacter sulfurreducens]UTG93839.1 FtsX-like permease family protein [Geobacter sulfurreducens]HBB69224.1 ABC transporter ATP-binding protein [Geobacter sulfurreducens]HCD97246.1 ABC transporter ATP-binding protein [Geobacter sulfurreducens]
MFIIKLLIRNAFRHKLRTGLTIVGVAIAIVAFGLLRTLVDLWYAGVEASSASRLITRNSISLVFPLPISYKDRIRQVPGVRDVSWGNWFGGIYKEEKNFFPSFAVEPRSFLAMYPEYRVDPVELKSFLLDRKGAMVGAKTAERFGWKVGDQVMLRGTIFPGQWEFVIRGIYHGAAKSTDETQFFFHWDYLNEVMRRTVPRRADQAGYYIIELKKPDQAAEVSLAVDATFRNSLAETLTETERAFQMSFVSMTEAIVIAIQIVSYVVIVIIMVVAANTMAMTARERIPEYATLKTLGFGGLHIAGVIFGESLVIAMAGGVTGVILTFPAARWIETELSQFFPVFTVAPSTICMDLAAAFIVGAVAGIFPTWRGVTIRIAEGLRRVG